MERELKRQVEQCNRDADMNAIHDPVPSLPYSSLSRNSNNSSSSSSSSGNTMKPYSAFRYTSHRTFNKGSALYSRQGAAGIYRKHKSDSKLLASPYGHHSQLDESKKGHRSSTNGGGSDRAGGNGGKKVRGRFAGGSTQASYITAPHPANSSDTPIYPGQAGSTPLPRAGSGSPRVGSSSSSYGTVETDVAIVTERSNHPLDVHGSSTIPSVTSSLESYPEDALPAGFVGLDKNATGYTAIDGDDGKLVGEGEAATASEGGVDDARPPAFAWKRDPPFTYTPGVQHQVVKRSEYQMSPMSR